jgi:hypothetical protein
MSLLSNKFEAEDIPELCPAAAHFTVTSSYSLLPRPIFSA